MSQVMWMFCDTTIHYTIVIVEEHANLHYQVMECESLPVRCTNRTQRIASCLAHEQTRHVRVLLFNYLDPTVIAHDQSGPSNLD